jgi:undecaprenyl-diphosphatase
MTRSLKHFLSALGAVWVKVFRFLGVWLLCGLALAAGSLLFFAWLADEVLEGSTRAFDESVRSFVNSHASPALTSAMRFVTMLGSTTWLVVLGVCAVAGFLITSRRRAALLFVVTMAGAAALNLILKASFARQRPEAFFDTPLPSSYSFPSGHALFSFCLFGTLAAIVNNRAKGVGIKIAVWVTAAVIVLLVGFSRIYLGVHYPSDVLAGFAGAFVWIMSVASVDRYLVERECKAMK